MPSSKRSDIKVADVVIDPLVAIDVIARTHLQYLDAVREKSPLIMVQLKDLACLLAMASLWADRR